MSPLDRLKSMPGRSIQEREAIELALDVIEKARTYVYASFRSQELCDDFRCTYSLLTREEGK